MTGLILLPRPRRVVDAPGAFPVRPGTTIALEGEAAALLATGLKLKQAAASIGVSWNVGVRSEAGRIVLRVERGRLPAVTCSYVPRLLGLVRAARPDQCDDDSDDSF